MRSAVFIQAHKDPWQVRRLCDTLSHPDVDIYLHLDLKANIGEWREILYDVSFIENRVDVRWGGFSQVEATLNSLREIADSEIEYGYIVFISGQDYPIIPVGRMVNLLSLNRGTEYIAHIKPEGDSDYEKNMRKRYEHRYYALPGRSLTVLANMLSRRLLPKRRPPMPVYKGSSWWNLTGDCVKYILGFCDYHPEYVRFFKLAHCADEMFFQTIVMNSPFAGKVMNDNFRYVDWSEGKANPKILGVDDFARITSSGKWFARKFDASTDSAVLDMLDDRIAGKQP